MNPTCGIRMKSPTKLNIEMQKTFDSTTYLAHYAISAGPRQSPNNQDAAFGMFRHVNHNFRPILQTAKCPSE